LRRRFTHALEMYQHCIQQQLPNSKDTMGGTIGYKLLVLL